jgi:Yip1 domain
VAAADKEEAKMATAPTTPEASAPASVSSFGRLFGVFFEPKATFESIVQRPTWVLPMLALILISVVIVALIGSRVGWRQVIDRQIANSPRAQQRMEQVPPAQRDEILNRQAKFAGVIGYVGVIVGTAIAEVVVAALLLAVFNIVGGSQIRFSQSLGIVTHSWMPYFITGLLGILILFIKDPSTIDTQNLVASNPGALLPDGSAKWMVSLLTSLDLFTFWVLVLQGIGYSTTNPKKLSFGKAFSYVLAVWVIFVLVKMGLAAAFA